MTAPLSASVLPGITRDSIMTLAHDLGLAVKEQDLPREMLYIADEAFFCGTAVEVTPIRSVDKIPVGIGRRGPVTAAVQQAHFDYINGSVPDRHGCTASWSRSTATPPRARAEKSALTPRVRPRKPVGVRDLRVKVTRSPFQDLWGHPFCTVRCVMTFDALPERCAPARRVRYPPARRACTARPDRRRA